MPIQFDASEVRQLSADIERGAERVGRNVSQAVKASAERVKTAGQSNAPVGPTGDLRESIGVDMYGDGRAVGLTAVIGPTVRYGLFVEKGTSKMAAQPFMPGDLAEVALPAYVAHLDQVLQSIYGK